jgi:hypothetical protein
MAARTSGDRNRFTASSLAGKITGPSLCGTPCEGSGRPPGRSS